MSYRHSLKVKVIAQSSRSEIVGFHGDTLKVKVRSAPTDGKANEEVIELIAAKMQKPKSYITLKYGASSPIKTFEILVHSESEIEDELG